jgi:hypothetical protein
MALQASLTPMRNSSPVSLTLVKHAKIEKMLLTSVVDTGEKGLTSVNDTTNVCFAGVIDTGNRQNRISLRIIEKK